MYIKKTERGCKMLTLETEMIHELVFKDYLTAKNFVNGFVAYTLSQSVLRVTTQDFGNVCDVSNLIVMENPKYNLGFRDFLTTQDLEAAFYHSVMFYMNTKQAEKPTPGVSADNLIAKRQVDYMEYLAHPLETFFNELIKRITHKFSNYDDKLILVNADLATPGLLAVSYKTVMRTPQLLQEYACYTPSNPLGS